MAKDLKSLVNTGTARELQEKLENWERDYEGNTSGQNMNRCCEILELNTAIQKQLFSILDEATREDAQNRSTDSVKHRLVPSLDSGAEDSLNISEGPLEGELPQRDVPCRHSCHLQSLENKLCNTRMQIRQMEHDLMASRAEERKTLRELQEMADCEQKIHTLRDEIALLDCEKSLLQNRCPGPKVCCLSMRTCSPPRPGRIDAAHRTCLIARFSYLYAHDRLVAETLLRTCICNMEMVQRIIYIAAVESFHAAKAAFRKVKISVKDALALHHAGPESLEVAALEYIACHKDLFNVCQCVQAVICCMSSNPKIPCAPEIDFCVIRNLIRELCCLAFLMQTLVPPLDIAVGEDGEVFNKSMYHRSCDSDFTASLVAYHKWPALMERNVVIVKGEAVTRTAIPVARSRSLSTRRVKHPRCC